MKLWLLRPVTGHREEGRWNPWYDKCFGYVIRSETEQEARQLAAENGGDENPHYGKSADSPWLDAAQSTCVELTADGEPGEVIRDFCAA